MDSPRYQTVVRRQHVRRQEIRVLLATVGVAVALGVGFYLGQRAAYSGMGIDPQRYREMEQALPETARKLDLIGRDLEVSQARNDIDRAALEMVRGEMAVQQEERQLLEESLRFYQSLMAPEDIAKGLIIQPVELLATDSEQRFAYRVIARQEAAKHSVLKGSLSIDVVGLLDGEEHSVPLASMNENLESNSLLLRFRYFQTLEGEIVLPVGFEPQSVSVVAKSTAPKKIEIRESFPWSVQKRYSYVGK